MKQIQFKLLLSSVLAIVSISNSGCKVTFPQKDAIAFQLEFQDGFKMQKVTATVNGCEILQDEELSSDFSLGVTDETFIAFSEAGELYNIFDDRGKCKCSVVKSDALELKMIVDLQSYEFIISLTKGKYIGISFIDGLTIEQSSEPFEYD